MCTHNGQHQYPLSGDLVIIQEILCQLAEDAYDALAPHTSRTDLERDKATINRRLACEGLSFATVTLPNLSKAFLASIEHETCTFEGFKTRNGLPVFLRGLFVCYKSRYRRTEALRAIYQITNLFKKLRGDYNKTTIMNMIQKFHDDDIKLGEAAREVENPSQTLQLARYFLNEYFQDFDLNHHSFVGRPGPGATNTKCPRSRRYEPTQMYRKHDDVMPYAVWFYPLLTDVNHRARHYIDLVNKSKLEPTARYKVVPKYWGKGRGICIEENESQFLQQTLAKGIRWKIDHSDLREYIQIDNQELNAQKALDASKDGENATIDMSDASDMILRLLVLFMFQDTAIVDALEAVTTQLISFHDEGEQTKMICSYNLALEAVGMAESKIPLVFRANKFAPMGSGLCFPIMTLVHYFLIKAIICRSYNVSPEEAGKVFVYGDDIVIPSKYAEAVFTELPLFGMKLNRNKSFVRSKFRESCGIHAYNGVDVTPVYMKYIPNTTKPTALHGAAVAEYTLRRNGFVKCANAIVRQLHRQDGSLEYVPPGRGVFGIYRDDLPKVPPFKRKWIQYADDRGNLGSPVDCCRVPTLVQRTVDSTLPTSTGALMRYWGVHSEDSAVVSDVPQDSEVHVKWKWRPVSAIYRS